MAEKKDPGKFTLGLNMADPSHRQVIDILNQQGRRKAQFIVNAILHYLHCPKHRKYPSRRQWTAMSLRKSCFESSNSKHPQSRNRTYPRNRKSRRKNQRASIPKAWKLS